MATELTTKSYRDYNNQVEITIKTAGIMSGEDMKTVQEAIKTIIETAEIYYAHPTKTEEK